MSKKVLLLLTLLLFPSVFASAVNIYPPVKLQKASIIDLILCKIGVEKCIKGINITKVKFLRKYKRGNVTVYEYLAKDQIEEYIPSEGVKSLVLSNTGPPFMDINLPTNATIGSSATQDLRVYIKYPEYFLTNQKVPMKVTFMAQNVYGATITISKLEFSFSTFTTTYNIDLILSNPVTLLNGNFISYHALFDLSPIYDNIVTTLEKSYTKKLYLTSVNFYVDGIGWVYCSADTSSSYNCYVANTSTYIYEGLPVFITNFYDINTNNYIGQGYSVIETDASIVSSATSCGTTGVAYDRNGDGLAECYTCPPNSHNPGKIIVGGYPYCVCNQGYLNLDNPYNGNTSITVPILDPTGCEATPSCSVVVSISPSSASVKPNEQTTYTVYIKNTGSVTCTYNLKATCPTGVSCYLSQTSVSVAPSSTQSVTLTALPTTQGQYTLSVTANSVSPLTGYSNTASAILTATINYLCSVNLTVNPQKITTTPNNQVTYNVIVTNNGNTQCTYNLQSSCPSGVTCSLSQTTVTIPSGSSTAVNLNALPNQPGNYTLTISALAQQYTGSATTNAYLEVISTSNTTTSNVVPVLYVTNPLIKLQPGNYTQVPIVIVNNGNNAGNISVNVLCPAGIICKLNTNSIYLQPGESKQITLYITAQQPGIYEAKVYAVGTTTNVVTLNVNVLPPATTLPSEITLTVNPSAVTMNYPGTASVQITATNNGNQTITATLSVECPQDLLDCQLSNYVLYLYPHSSSTATLNLYSKNPGSGTVVVVLKNGGTHYKVIQVTVNQPGQQSLFPINFNISNPNQLLILLIVLLVILIIITIATRSHSQKKKKQS